MKTIVVLLGLLLFTVFAPSDAGAGPDVLGCNLADRPDRVKSCLDGKVNDLRNEARNETARKMEETRRQVREEFEKSPYYANIQGEKDLLKGVKDMRLTSLFSCLDGVRGSPRGLPKSVEKFNADPGNLGKWAIEDMWSTAESAFQDVMQEEIAEVRNPRPHDGVYFIDLYWTKLQRLSSKHEALRCLVQYLEPYMPRIKQAARDAQQQLETKIRAAWEKIRPLLEQAVADGVAKLLEKAIEKAPTAGNFVMNKVAPGSAAIGDADREGNEMVGIARGVVASYILDAGRVNDHTDKVNALTAALRAKQNPAPALAAARTSLDSTFSASSALYIDIAVALLRYKGHKYINSDVGPVPPMPPGGGWMVENALAAVATFKDEIKALVVSACGLIPEAGAVTCANVGEAVDQAWKWVMKPALKAGAVFALDKMFDLGMDFAQKRLKQAAAQNVDPTMNELRRQSGPVGPALDRLQSAALVSFSEKYVGDMKTALERYDQSVKSLAEVAVTK